MNLGVISLTELWPLFGFHQFFHECLYLIQDPIHHPTLHLAAVSLVSFAPQSFLVFWVLGFGVFFVRVCVSLTLMRKIISFKDLIYLRERERKNRGGAEGEASSLQRREPHLRLDPRTLGSWPELKSRVGRSTDRATQVPQEDRFVKLSCPVESETTQMNWLWRSLTNWPWTRHFAWRPL